MNQTVITLLAELNKFLGFYLDKLKIKSPLAYTALQAVNASSIIIIASEEVNLGNFEAYVITFLVGLSSLMNPRTSQMAQQYKNDNTIQLPRLDDTIDGVDLNQPERQG